MMASASAAALRQARHQGPGLASQLAERIFPPTAKHRIMVMLSAYFDESGTHPTSSSIAVGGFVSTAKGWRRFERQWQRELDAEGIRRFHASELESLKGEFSDWTTDRKIAFQRRILSIIKQHAIYGISAAVVRAEYNRLVSNNDDSEMPKKVGTPYGLLVYSCVRLTVEWTRKKYAGEPVAFIFEDGVAKSANEIPEWFARQKRIDTEMGSLVFAGKDVLPLQAADLHAYEAWKHTENWWVDREKKRAPRKSLESLLQMDCNGYLWDETNLLRRIEDVRGAKEY